MGANSRSQQKLDALGMAYTEWPREKQYAFVASLRLFTERTFDSATNLFKGTYRGCKVTGMDYSYTWGVGRYQTAYTQTVVLLHDAVTGVPNFVLSPRGMLDRISPWLSKDRIELEGEKQFNRQFALSGGLHEDDIAECFTSEVIDLCLEDATLSIEVFSGDLIVCRQGRAVAAGGYEPFLEQAIRLAEALAQTDDAGSNNHVIAIHLECRVPRFLFGHRVQLDSSRVGTVRVAAQECQPAFALSRRMPMNHSRRFGEVSLTRPGCTSSTLPCRPLNHDGTMTAIGLISSATRAVIRLWSNIRIGGEEVNAAPQRPSVKTGRNGMAGTRRAPQSPEDRAGDCV